MGARSRRIRPTTRPAKPGRPTPRVRRGSDRFTAHFRLERSADAAKARRMLRQAGLDVIATTAKGGIVVAATRSQIENLVPNRLKEKPVTRHVNRAQGLAVRRSYEGPSSSSGCGRRVALGAVSRLRRHRPVLLG